MDCAHSIRVLCVLGRSNGKGVSPPLPQRDGTLIRRHRPVAASIDAELTEAWRRLSPQSAPVGTRSSASAPAAIGFAAMQEAMLVQSALGGLPMAPCQTILVSNNSGERLGGLRSSRS